MYKKVQYYLNVNEINFLINVAVRFVVWSTVKLMSDLMRKLMSELNRKLKSFLIRNFTHVYPYYRTVFFAFCSQFHMVLIRLTYLDQFTFCMYVRTYLLPNRFFRIFFVFRDISFWYRSVFMLGLFLILIRLCTIFLWDCSDFFNKKIEVHKIYLGANKNCYFLFTYFIYI